MSNMKEHHSRVKRFVPYTYRSYLIVVLMFCYLLTFVFTFSAVVIYNTGNANDEVEKQEVDFATGLIGLDQEISIPITSPLRIITPNNLTLSVIDKISNHLTEKQISTLSETGMLTVRDNASSQPVTYVKMGESYIQIGALQNNSLRTYTILRIFSTCITFLLAALCICFLASRRLAKPITSLTNATRIVTNGDFSVRLPSDENGEVGELMRAFNTMTESLDKNAYIQKDFIASISHEFKTPIASIKGFARLLQMPGLTEEQRTEYIDLIVAESDRLSRMSQTLLRLSALQQQAIHPTLSEFRVDEQIRQVIVTLAPIWEARMIDWQLDLDPVIINSDEQLLRQVWINLIQNAVKFSGRGSSIEITLKGDDPIVMSVSDHGIGMDKETMSRVFDRFYQADASRSKEGIGLGLSLVKRIVQILGGTVDVSSEADIGSTFKVTIPQCKADKEIKLHDK